MNFRVFVLLIFIGFGCGEEIEKPNPNLSGPGYYPLAIGNYWIYDVEQVVITLLESDTSTFQLREILVDSIVSALGDVTYLISRETRSTPAEPWEADSLWTVRNTSQSVVVTESNVPFVKLVFPVAEGQTWDGNSFNNKGNQTYRFDSVLDDELPGVWSDADSVAFIRTIISDISSAITGTDQRSEIYGEGVGLIEKDYLRISLCTTECDAGDTLGGLRLSQELIEFGAL